MNRLLLGVLWLAGIPAAWADEPLPPPRDYRFCTASDTFCASVSQDTGTRVSRRDSATGEYREIYRIAGWHRFAFLSPDGEFFAAGNPGGNLLAPDAGAQTVLLTIWTHGQKTAHIRLGEVLSSMASLEHTVSHVHWGTFGGFDARGQFVLDTVEGRTLLVDPSSGAIHLRTAQ